LDRLTAMQTFVRVVERSKDGAFIHS
jgi:hypothetical protein